MQKFYFDKKFKYIFFVKRSNFEIARIDFFTSPQYQEFFNYLDHLGGFFYERWGDAPVHSLALSLFAPKEKVCRFANPTFHF